MAYALIRPYAIALIAFSLLVSVRGQQAGAVITETHPKLTSQECTESGGCTTSQTSIVLDSNWRWLHSASGTDNCYTGNTWDTTFCPDGVSCATSCALDGADYAGTGITTSGNALTLRFVTGANIGSRVYLMASDTQYQIFKLKNQQFSFDVDMSRLSCGLKGAVYFVQMDADGGMAKYPGNKAGAKYGTGYCDAQCPHDIKFINGVANSVGWKPSDNDINAGAGQYGTCCTEIDIWEGNSQAAAYTPHVCTVNGQTRCSGAQCGDNLDNRYGGICDKDGCDFNSYRMGDQSFLGEGKTVDTRSKFTVVTQFITADGTANGTLTEIRRLYVQNGKVIQNSMSNIPSISASNSISDNFCVEQKTAFGDKNDFAAKGGLSAMGDALSTGMVLALSIWDDHAANMLWLDSTYPPDKEPSAPGVKRGPCPTTSAHLPVEGPNASVTFSNIRVGDIGSMYNATGGGTKTTGGSDIVTEQEAV